MNTCAINIKNLTLRLSGKKILDGISLDVQRGEYISIIGPNGAGKTSLVKCIGHLYSNWSGTIEVNGKSLIHFPQRELAKQLSYVPQAEGRTLPFTVFEFVLMGRYPHLSPFTTVSANDKQIVTDTLEIAGLLPFRDRRVDTLSGGERQMVFIAASLAQGAEILLMDEPTSFLDYRHQAQVMKLLKRLNRQNRITIVSVSHDINAACVQSDRIVALKDGTCAFVDVPENALNAGRLEALYETPFLVADHPSGNGCIVLAEDTE